MLAFTSQVYERAILRDRDLKQHSRLIKHRIYRYTTQRLTVYKINLLPTQILNANTNLNLKKTVKKQLIGSEFILEVYS